VQCSAVQRIGQRRSSAVVCDAMGSATSSAFD
jgi:hypothetical protein